MTLFTYAARPVAVASASSSLSGTFATATTGADTLTGSASALVVDGYTVNLNDRVLLKDQSTAFQNGVYTLTTAGVTAPSPSGVIATLNNLVGGSGYNNFPPSYNVTLTGGSGTGATATVTAASGSGTITSVTIVNGGTGYVVGDVLGISGAGANGTGFSIHVATLAPVTAGSGSGPITGMTITTPGTLYTSGSVVAPLTGGTGSGATATVTVATGTIYQLYNQVTGTGYSKALPQVYSAVALTGGTGSGATGNFFVNGTGGLQFTGMVNCGTGYTPGDVLSVSASSVGGTGSGFAITVLEVKGAVSSVTIASPGTGYVVGDVLGLAVGGSGSGCKVTVSSVVASNWVLTRAGDARNGVQLQGMQVSVLNGTTNANTTWVQTATPVVRNTTALTFVNVPWN